MDAHPRSLHHLRPRGVLRALVDAVRPYLQHRHRPHGGQRKGQKVAIRDEKVRGQEVPQDRAHPRA